MIYIALDSSCRVLQTMLLDMSSTYWACRMFVRPSQEAISTKDVLAWCCDWTFGHTKAYWTVNAVIRKPASPAQTATVLIPG
jgi:hypothetical protein